MRAEAQACAVDSDVDVELERRVVALADARGGVTARGLEDAMQEVDRLEAELSAALQRTEAAEASKIELTLALAASADSGATASNVPLLSLKGGESTLAMQVCNRFCLADRSVKSP